MIELKNISFSYGEQEVLKDFSLKVEKGECVLLSGPSGCGKSTVFKLICGLLTPDSGQIIVPKKLSVVFQEDRLLTYLSLKSNVMLPVKKDKEPYVLSLLSEIGLGDAYTKKVRDLSGGMSRRAAIVRAVAFSGDVFILDEPFNGIDKENKQKLALMLKREVLDKGIPILLASHVKEDAELLGARTVKM